MSLGLPEFGAAGVSGGGGPVWGFIRSLGLAALVYSLASCALSWNAGRLAREALDRARGEATLARSTADEARKRLSKNADWSIALASVESSPQHILADLNPLLPAGVSIASLRVEYTSETTARVDLGVISVSPEAYDRFLRALAHSRTFTDIKPGSENRPGPLRATVSAVHRPAGKAS